MVSICLPLGLVTTRLPSFPLAVRMFPFAASVRPSGSFKLPPLESVAPVLSLLWRVSGSSIAAIRLLTKAAYQERGRRVATMATRRRKVLPRNLAQHDLTIGLFDSRNGDSTLFDVTALKSRRY